jgi:hypothetical protein
MLLAGSEIRCHVLTEIPRRSLPCPLFPSTQPAAAVGVRDEINVALVDIQSRHTNTSLLKMPPDPIVVDDDEGDIASEAKIINEVSSNFPFVVDLFSQEYKIWKKKYASWSILG